MPDSQGPQDTCCPESFTDRDCLFPPLRQLTLCLYLVSPWIPQSISKKQPSLPVTSNRSFKLLLHLFLAPWDSSHLFPLTLLAGSTPTAMVRSSRKPPDPLPLVLLHLCPGSGRSGRRREASVHSAEAGGLRHACGFSCDAQLLGRLSRQIHTLHVSGHCVTARK